MDNLPRRKGFRVYKFVLIKALTFQGAKVFGIVEVDVVGHNRRIGAHGPQFDKPLCPVGGFFRQFPGGPGFPGFTPFQDAPGKFQA
jgi:hypothetical protein